MARDAWFHGKRVSVSHETILNELERRGVLHSINQGRRTIAEQTAFWNAYQRFLRGGPWAPLAAFPSPGAPHILWGKENHALDISDGIVDRVAAEYRKMGIPAVLNTVRGEPWHVIFPDEGALIRAAASLRGKGGLLATLKPGMNHRDVRYLRWLLVDTGHFKRRFWKKLRRSTKYGRDMQKAVKKFQRGHGLVADGIVGQQTWAKIRKVAARD